MEAGDRLGEESGWRPCLRRGERDGVGCVLDMLRGRDIAMLALGLGRCVLLVLVLVLVLSGLGRAVGVDRVLMPPRSACALGHDGRLRFGHRIHDR